MAYDPNDAADKKIVDKLIQDAVDAALSEAQTEHDNATKGLKANNDKLLKQMKEGTGDPAEIARLTEENAALTLKVRDTTKALTAATKAADEATKGLETESGFARKLLVDNGLTEALVGNNVAKQFLPAVKAMLAGQVTVKIDGENRSAMIGDKSLGDFVKEWSQSDDGKHYVAAPSNQGGGAPGGGASGGGGKTMTRAAYEQQNSTNPAGMAKFFSEGGTLTD